MPPNSAILNPTFKVPLISDALNHATNQVGQVSLQLDGGSLSQETECGFFERNYYKCMEAFGMHLGRMHCQLEARDLTECVQQDKSVCAV